MNDQAPAYLTSLLPSQVGARTGYELRNRGALDTALTRINSLAYSFFPSTTKLWNNLDNERKTKPSLKAFQNSHTITLPKKKSLYYRGGRLENCIQARMRMSNSPLKSDLFTELHVIESPDCPCGSGQPETHEHFFFECHLFDIARAELRNNLLPFVINNADFLLFGVPNEDNPSNAKIFDAVHTYIRETKRFY
jgi:hypothetical protein